jgi:ABC-type transporter Mla subunit MlaD
MKSLKECLQGRRDPAPPRTSHQKRHAWVFGSPVSTPRPTVLCSSQSSQIPQTIRPPFSNVKHQTGNRNPEYVNRATHHLITALRQTLQQLEATVPDSADQLVFAELKRILNQRISDLEECVQDLPPALASDKV